MREAKSAVREIIAFLIVIFTLVLNIRLYPRAFSRGVFRPKPTSTSIPFRLWFGSATEFTNVSVKTRSECDYSHSMNMLSVYVKGM